MDSEWEKSKVQCFLESNGDEYLAVNKQLVNRTKINRNLNI